MKNKWFHLLMTIITREIMKYIKMTLIINKMMRKRKNTSKCQSNNNNQRYQIFKILNMMRIFNLMTRRKINQSYK